MTQTPPLRDLADLGKATGIAASKKERPAFWDTRALPIRLDRLMAFIAAFQRQHSGATPNKRAMAAEMEDKEEAVQYWLNRLENTGRVHVISRNPLRIMLKQNAPDLISARRIDDALKGSKIGWELTSASERFDAAEAQRFRIAHFVGSYWEQNGQGPSLQEIADAVGMSGPGYVTGALQILRDKRLITFNPDVPRSARLTEEGRMSVGVHSTPSSAPARPPARAPVSAPVSAPARSQRIEAALEHLKKAKSVQASAFEQRVEDIYNWCVAFVRRHGRGPTNKEIAVEFGGGNPQSTRVPVARLIERGKLGKPRSGGGTFKVSTLPVLVDGKMVGGGEVSREAQAPIAPQPTPKPALPKPRVAAEKRVRPQVAQGIEKRKAIHAFMVDHYRQHGDLPMMKVIAAKFFGGAHHPASAANAINRLVADGYIEYPRGSMTKGTVFERPGGPAVKGPSPAPAEAPKTEAPKVKAAAKAATERERHRVRTSLPTLRKLAAVLHSQIARFGMISTAAELAGSMGWTSANSARTALNLMEELGWLAIDRSASGKMRMKSVRFTERGEEIAREELGLDKPEPPSNEEKGTPEMANEINEKPDPDSREWQEQIMPEVRTRMDRAIEERQQMSHLARSSELERAIPDRRDPRDPRYRDQRYEEAMARSYERPVRDTSNMPVRLADFSDQDLVFELMMRGYTVRRG